MKTYIYERSRRKVIEEDAYKVSGLRFLYETRSGRLLTKFVLKRRSVSAAYGRYMKSTASKKEIPRFIRHYRINVDEIKRPLPSFISFNDFFIRELKENARSIDMAPGNLISPADSRVFVFPTDDFSKLPVKGYWYQLNELVKNKNLSLQYEGGWCFIYRLAPSDYHRYCYIDYGVQEEVIKINGALHSVNPIALTVIPGLMAKNYREMTVLHTQNFGDVLHIEIGALFVGKVIQRHDGTHRFLRGEEKGWFEFGGSTVIQLFKKETVSPDTDILEQSGKGVETLVKMGEKVGTKV